MQTCDILIVGGGPGGAACAWQLRRLGLDVVVLDRAVFPRHKVCAGWITPPILQSLEIDVADYSAGRVFQPFTAFEAGLMGGRTIRTEYDSPASYGIRRCEFDDYLLQRAGAKLLLGKPLKSIRREGESWVVNDELSARLLIGAGGHFCPVARMLSKRAEAEDGAVILAQEAEFPIPEPLRERFPVDGRCPEFFFCPDLAGYGWIVRKGDYLNVGLGREHERNLSAHMKTLLDELRRLGKLPCEIPQAFQGHAYRLRKSAPRFEIPPGVLLIGDALGLAYPQSGEGIRPAIESGLIAADYIAETPADWSRISFAELLSRCAARFGANSRPDPWKRMIPRAVWNYAARLALRSRWFHRRILLDRWFLHRHQPAL
jgi:flavin-dependent dehydrogenase